MKWPQLCAKRWGYNGKQVPVDFMGTTRSESPPPRLRFTQRPLSPRPAFPPSPPHLFALLYL